jgi:hypothetical protein
MSLTPTVNIDYTNKDYEGFRNMMINELGIQMPEYTDRSQTDAGIVILELLAKGLDILSFYQDAQANEAFLVTEEQRENVLKWCSMLDYTPRNANAAKYKQVFKLTAIRGVDTIIPKGTLIKTLETASEASESFEVIQDFTIPAGSLGDEKIGEVYQHLADVVHGITVSGEVVGTSNGTEDQVFTLKYTPAIVGSISIFVNEGAGFEPWTRVDNFIDSTATDHHYKVRINDNDEAQVIFGNGISGKIPTPYTQGIMSEYRIGGGSLGNVGANKITILDSSVAYVEGTFNPDLSYEKGFDKETIGEMKINAPNSFRTKWVCLEDKDFADKVKELFPQVVFASAKKDAVNIDDINVYVLLKDNAVLTTELRNQIEAMYEERKLTGVGNVNLLHPPVFVPTNFVASLVVQDRFKQSIVEAGVTAFITDYFAVGNYDFNKELSLTDLESLVKGSTAGVKSFRFTTPSAMVITPAYNEILTLGTLTFNTSGGIV